MMISFSNFASIKYPLPPHPTLALDSSLPRLDSEFRHCNAPINDCAISQVLSRSQHLIFVTQRVRKISLPQLTSNYLVPTEFYLAPMFQRQERKFC